MMSIGSTLKSLSDRLFGKGDSEPKVALNATQMKAGLIDIRNKLVSYSDKHDYDTFNGVLSTLDIPDQMTDEQVHDVLTDLVEKLTHRGFIDEDIQAVGPELLVTTMMHDIEITLDNTGEGELALHAIRFDQNTERYANGGRVINMADYTDDGPSQ